MGERARKEYLRCTVQEWSGHRLTATTTEGTMVHVDCSDVAEVVPLLWTGAQLNLLHYKEEQGWIVPRLVVLEPDFLMDVTAVASCFAHPDTHPLAYSLNRLKPKPNSQAILLGNFAGAALDNQIYNPQTDVVDTLWRSFREQALQFCTCPDFNGQQFIEDARQQAANLTEIADRLFADYDRQQALLEPSFVCEELGLQGRIDLMTADLSLLVEQKSGRNHRIERQAAIVHRHDHFVQLLLYYGILRATFQLPPTTLHPYLLYSKYPAQQGLLGVDYQPQLLTRAIHQRNLLVAWEYHFARQDTSALLSQLPPMEPTEQDYFVRMTSFIYREQLCSRVDVQPGQYAISDLWRMPLEEKLSTGNIYTGLHLMSLDRSRPDSGYDRVTLSVNVNLSEGETDYVRNFRRGDAIYLYGYDEGEIPDIRHHILYKGTLEEIHEDYLIVRLTNGQQNRKLFANTPYAIEHGSTDATTSNYLRSIYELVTAPDIRRRQLLLGLRRPENDPTVSLSRSYHPDYDDVLLRAMQARDYFLLVGPPGTGKTSMALRFLVEEALTQRDANVLLTAYTNRAVDEICEMLTSAGLNYLRIGSETTCDPRFVHRLLEHLLGERPRLTEMQALIRQMPIIVATTSMLQARPFLFDIKNFTLCIVDEASQLLEPAIVGILTKGIGRFVLIGDYKQLPAVVQQKDGGDCTHSLFERLLKQERLAGRTQFIGILHKQGRMHPDVAEFTNKLFYAREQISPVPLPHQQETTLDYTAPAEDALDKVLKLKRVVFIDSTHADNEAQLVADLLRRLRRLFGTKFDPLKSIGVIVPYRIEIGRIRRELERLGIPDTQDITIDTVERYQGSQRDVIVYAFAVDSPTQLSFLTATCFKDDDGCIIDRKLNVAMTRARRQLVMTGRADILQHNPLFAKLIERYNSENNTRTT